MKNFLVNLTAVLVFLGSNAFAQQQDEEDYFTGNDYRFPVNPDRPECRWMIEDKTIGELLRSRSDSRYFVRGLDALDLASTTIDDPNVNLTVIVSGDSYFEPGSYFDILNLLDEHDRLFNVLARHISLTALTATVADGGQRRQEILTLRGTVLNFTTSTSSMLRQTYYMNGRFFSYEGGICLSNGILFFGHNQIFNEILAEQQDNN